MELVINLKLPKDIVREMNVYRKKYHPSGLSHSSAHITVVPPFFLRGSFEDLTGSLIKCIHPIKPFHLTINGLGLFGENVLFLKPNCPFVLKKLHGDLKRLIGHNFRRRGHDSYWEFRKYHPHVTIAKDKAASIKKYKQELRGIIYRREVLVESINLYTRRKDGRWVLKRNFLFQG